MCSGEHLVEMDLETNFLRRSDQCGANMHTKLLLSRFSPSWILPGHILAAATCRLRGWAECFPNRTWVRTAHSHGIHSRFRAERKTYIQEEWFTFQGKWDGVNCLTEVLASRFDSQKTCDDSHSSHPNTWASFIMPSAFPTQRSMTHKPLLLSAAGFIIRELYNSVLAHTIFFLFCFNCITVKVGQH